MAAGSTQYTIQCVLKSPNNGNSTAPCVTVGANRYVPVMVQTYEIDPASASYIDAIATPFDYALGTSFFMFGFCGIIFLHLMSHGIGLVLKMVRYR
jgi:hypothetical protein